MDTIDIVFNIMMGLPGSGKTYFCTQSNNHFDYNTQYIYVDLDKYKDDDKDITDILWDEFDYKYLTTQRYYNNKKRDVYIDGLILNKDILQKIICTCLTYTHNCDCTISFVIHMWDDNRKVCINNDRYRVKSGQRETSSEFTIEHINFEKVLVEDVREMISKITEKDCSVKIEKHKVYELCSYNTIIEPFENGWKDKGFLVSDTWSGGGTCGSCWDDNLSTISADPIPEFEAFNEMLLKICPSISFLQYKKLYNSSVIVDETKEYDYYGGCETIFKYKCDLKKLYSELLDMGLVEP